MPVHFDRFRFLNEEPKRFRNDSDYKTVELIIDGVPYVIPPKGEFPIPGPEGADIILNVPRE